jgi:uncharacterized RmlC-like cupin family protein
MPLDKDRLGALASDKSSYEEWRDKQSLPVVTGFHIEDLRDVELEPWDWKGGSAAFLDLEGTGDTSDAYILELAPGEKTTPRKHVYEELVYVLAGHGRTRVWQDGEPEVSFEWGAGAVFAIPLNANYQHVNISGQEPARYIAVTDAPIVINLFHNLDFVFDCPFPFKDRFTADPGYFNGDGRSLPGRVWDTNFIADVNALPLLEWDARGKGSTNRMIELSDSSLCAHVSEFPVGRYKKAHRHGPGAHVIIIAGDGYSLMWPEGEEPKKFDWKVGSLIVPPNQWYHQHFNAGAEPAKYLALRWNSAKYWVFHDTGIDSDVTQGGNQIETADEAPIVRETFEATLRARGIEPRM